MIETAVVLGEGSAERDFTAGWSAERAVMVAAVGLMGVTGRDSARYHANTRNDCQSGVDFKSSKRGVGGCWTKGRR